MTPFALNKSSIPDQYELLVYGDIGDSWTGETVSAKNVAEQIQNLDPKVKQITIRVNSFGGSVADGIAIHNALRQHPANKKVIIDGVAMSIASLIAMAGDQVEAFDSSIFMIHAPWGNISGNAAKMRGYADMLDTFAEAMAGAYVRKTGKDIEHIREMLTDGQDHYFTAEEAKAFGLIDSIRSDAKTKAAAVEGPQGMAFAMMKRHLTNTSDKMAGMAISAALRAPILDGNMDPETVVKEEAAPTPAEIAAFDKVVEEENAAAPEAAAVVEPEAKADPIKALEEKFAKAQAEAEAKVLAAKAETEALAKALADEREKIEIQASVRHAAECYANLPGKAEDLGPALRVLAKMAPEAHVTIKAILDSTNGLLANAEKIQMASVGKVGDIDLTPEARLEAEVKKVREKNQNMTVEQAKAAVYRANPKLVRELRGEKD